MTSLVSRRTGLWLLAGAILLLVFVRAGASTNSVWFARVWQTEDGLPDNQVTGIAQTSDGFLWVATPGGLTRFDGVQFERVPLAGFPGVASLPNRIINSLFRDREERLWMGLGGRVTWLNPETGRFAVVTNVHETGYVRRFVEDGEGAIWIVHAGGAISRIQDGRAIPFAPQDRWFRDAEFSLAADSRGRIWFVRRRQVGMFRDGHFKVLGELDNLGYSITARREGGVWVCSGSHLFKCDEAGSLEDMGAFGSGGSESHAAAVLEDTGGAVWLGTLGNGLFRYTHSRFESVPITYQHVWRLLEDREGNIWAGTGGGGLDEVCPRVVESEGEESGLQMEGMRSICEDAGGTLWTTTQSGALLWRKGGVWSKALPGGHELDNVACVATDRAGAVWVSVNSGNVLYRWQHDRLSAWHHADGLESGGARVLFPGANGDLWIGGSSLWSLQRMRDGHLRSVALPSGRGVRAMTEDAAGNLWLATIPDGLWRMNHDQLHQETAQLPSAYRSIQCFCATPDGSVWMGFFDGGLGRLKEGQVAVVSQAQGLFGAGISRMIEDDRGCLWLGTQQGIFRIRQEELDAVADGRAKRVRCTHYGKEEGLRSTQASRDYFPGALRSTDGRIWISMRSGLAVIQPDNVPDHTKPPPVLIGRVAVDDRTVASHGRVFDGRDEWGQSVVNLRRNGRTLFVKPGYRKLEFQFTALSFVAPENINFRYQLEGFDRDWVSAGTTRRAGYPRLSAGHYQFRVTACNNDGVWNETGAVVGFTVEPFFWQTWWFRIGMSVVLIGAIFGTVRYVWFRRLQNRLRVLEQQEALHKERARIAKDLHDDLGASLTQIALLSELAQSDYEKPDEARGHLDNVFRTAHNLTRSLDEIVWAVNPRNDTLDQFVAHLCNFAQGFLRAADVRCRLDVPLELPHEPLLPTVRHHLYLAVKETLHNVVKHAEATEVWLRMTIGDGTLKLSVEDNGKGFVRAHAGKTGADGLMNLEQRMKEVEGRFAQRSRPEGGTINIFAVPFRSRHASAPG